MHQYPLRSFEDICSLCPVISKNYLRLLLHKELAIWQKQAIEGSYLFCKICNKREKSRKRLQVHVYKVHREHRYRYICPQCPKTYKAPDPVRRHLLNHHNIPRSDQGPIHKYVVN